MTIEDVCSNPDQPILIHCGGGGRAALATKSLNDMGYTDVSSIDARFSDLQSAVADDGS
jgi:rhodanese-related sulfurtransferase